MKPTDRSLSLVLAVSVGLLALPGFAPAAGARLFKSGPIQITADGQTVWVANQDNDSVTRIVTSTEAVTEFVLPPSATKHSPRGLSVMEDGSDVWVACHDSDRLYVLSGSTGGVVARIDLPWGSGPCSIAISPSQQTALVTLHRSASLAVIDLATRQLSRIIKPVYWAPTGIAWTRDGASAWVTHIFAEGEHPYLSQVRFGGPEPVLATQVRVGATQPQNSASLAAPYDIAEGGYLTTRGHPAQPPAPSGLNQIWLPTQYNNIHDNRYSPDSTIQTTMRHVDLNTRTIPNAINAKIIFTAVHVHDTTSGQPYRGPGWNARISGPIDLAFSTDGTMAYMLNELSDDLLVFPVGTPHIKPAGAAPLPEVEVGNRPKGLAVSPASPLAYVYNQFSRDVSVVDLAIPAEVRRIPLNPVTTEPFSSTVMTGARIFHTSNDPRISGNNKVACASCHINGEHDGRSWAFHVLPGPHGPRDVPSLPGLTETFGPPDPVTGFGQLHRSGDRDEVQDFEHTFQGVQMGGTGFLGAGVQSELGLPNAGRDSELDALASYLFSLPPIPRSPHRASDGSLSEGATRGATFFTGNQRQTRPADSHCADCHIPEEGFVDRKFHDVGSQRSASEEELNNRTPAWVVNTPTLRGIWTTPPYGGSSTFESITLLTLLQNLASRAGSPNRHGTPDGLTQRQLRDLEEFVLSIDGNMNASEVRNARDTTPPRIRRAEAASLTRIHVWFNESVKPAPAEAPANWALETAGGQPVPITSAFHDTLNGDRVTLITQLQPQTDYRLRGLGGILDEADTASNGTANALDPNDPDNTRSLPIGTSLTVTLGASPAHHINVPVHDTAMVGSGLSTWSHDHVWLVPNTTGFLRFDWKAAFAQTCGVSNAADILSARLTLHGDYGDAQTVQLRRTLQPWSDPASGGDWNSSATGAPTWRDHAHPSSRWNTAGARALGGTGGSLADYNGAYDLAEQIDATVQLTAVNREVDFEGPQITEAFRFWFANPSVDYGYALRLTSSGTQELKFHRWENEFSEDSPALTLTYALPVISVTVVRAGDNIIVNWPQTPDGFLLESASTPQASAPWTEVTHPVILTNGARQATLPASPSQQFFRLRK